MGVAVREHASHVVVFDLTVFSHGASYAAGHFDGEVK
jgi:hypothetical protein